MLTRCCLGSRIRVHHRIHHQRLQALRGLVEEKETGAGEKRPGNGQHFTRKVVQFLVPHPMIEAVLYPELASHPDQALAKRLLPRGCGSVFSFNMKGGREAGRRFIEALRVFSHLANVGDAKSLVIHPATTTHYRMTEEDLKKAGITAGTVRLSIGLEDPEDLIDDLSRGLHAAEKGR